VIYIGERVAIQPGLLFSPFPMASLKQAEAEERKELTFSEINHFY
jgi:hypothetical protein